MYRGLRQCYSDGQNKRIEVHSVLMLHIQSEKLDKRNKNLQFKSEAVCTETNRQSWPVKGSRHNFHEIFTDDKTEPN